MTYNIPSHLESDSEIYLAIEKMELPAVYANGEYWQAEQDEKGYATGLWLVDGSDDPVFFTIESYGDNSVTLSA